MPACVSYSSNSKKSWSFDLRNSRLRELAAMSIRDDRVRFPTIALGYDGPMRWGTASAFSTIYQTIEEDMKNVDFPFVIFHAPDDKVCSIEGSERLLALCATSDKTCLQFVGGRHAIQCARQDDFVKQGVRWL